MPRLIDRFTIASRVLTSKSIAMTVALTLSGCASEYSNVSNDAQNLLFDQFREGRAELPCNLSCAYRKGTLIPEFKSLYESQQWRELALGVIELGSQDDQSWFYLGEAAEGMGYPEAATIYYRHSVNVSEKLEPGWQCHTFLADACDGFTFPIDSEARLNAIANTHVASVQTNQPVISAPPSASDQISAPTEFGKHRSSSNLVPMKNVGGTYAVPVLINNVIPLDFIVDSGATDVSIPADVLLTLFRTGTISREDFLESRTYVLADGTEVPSQTFRIRSLKVGKIILNNVRGSVAPVKGNLLLGQSFLSRFKSWSINNSTHSLVLE